MSFAGWRSAGTALPQAGETRDVCRSTFVATATDGTDLTFAIPLTARAENRYTLFLIPL
jgi:hypothetical protein